MELITHLLQRADWEKAQVEGEYRPASLETEGFIHCSRPEQVHGTALRYYREAQDMLLLWIDPGRVQAEIRWEPSHGELYPHIYGALNLEAVVRVEGFELEGGDS